MDRIIIAVLVMALVSYLPRSLPMLLMKKEVESKFIQSFLFYMPYAVLSAMTFPAVMYSTGNTVVGIAGTVVAFILAFLNQGLLKTLLFTVIFVYFFNMLF